MSGPTDPAEAHFDKGLWGWDLAQWRKMPMIWGYSDRWAEVAVGTSTGGAATNAETTPVPAGYVYVLNYWTVVHTDTVVRSSFLTLAVGNVEVYLLKDTAMIQDIEQYGAVSAVLKEGDTARFVVWGLTEGKYAILNVWGYKMAVGQ